MNDKKIIGVIMIPIYNLLYKLPGVQPLSSKSHDKEEITH